MTSICMNHANSQKEVFLCIPIRKNRCYKSILCTFFYSIKEATISHNNCVNNPHGWDGAKVQTDPKILFSLLFYVKFQNCVILHPEKEPLKRSHWSLYRCLFAAVWRGGGFANKVKVNTEEEGHRHMFPLTANTSLLLSFRPLTQRRKHASLRRPAGCTSAFDFC